MRHRTGGTSRLGFAAACGPQNFDTFGKTTFATLSALFGHPRWRINVANQGKSGHRNGARKTSGLSRLVVLARAHAFGFRKSRVGRFSQTIAGNKTRKISKLEVGSINGRAVFPGG
jgi:hypothetical protein